MIFNEARENEDEDWNASALDRLAEIETGITGHCGPSSIIQFQGDPQDLDELTAMVRGGKW